MAGPEVKTIFSADTTGLKAGAAEATRTVKAAAQEMGKDVAAATTVNRGVGLGPGAADNPFARASGQSSSASRRGVIGGIGSSIREATAPMRQFVGSLTGAVAIVTRLTFLLGLVTTAVGAIKLGIDAVSSGGQKAAEELARVQARIEAFRKQRAEVLAEEFKAATGIGIPAEQVEGELARLSELVANHTKLVQELEKNRADQRSALALKDFGGALLFEREKKIVTEINELLVEKDRLTGIIAERNRKIAQSLEEQRAKLENLVRAEGLARARLGARGATERLAADVSRATALLEILVRQTRGTR